MQFVVNDLELKFPTGLTILYFYSSWFQFHDKMMIMLGKAEEIYDGLNIFCIDIEYFKNIDVRFKLKSIPTITILFDGKEVKRISLVMSTKDFIDILADIYDRKYGS
jgi:thiol-disulfide isomerase/thioredoxin